MKLGHDNEEQQKNTMTNSERAAWHAAYAEQLLNEGRGAAPAAMGRASAHATLALYYRDLAS